MARTGLDGLETGGFVTDVGAVGGDTDALLQHYPDSCETEVSAWWLAEASDKWVRIELPGLERSMAAQEPAGLLGRGQQHRRWDRIGPWAW